MIEKSESVERRVSEVRDWVVAVQAGSEDAFECLTARYRPIAISLAKQTLGADEAEDVVQDSFLIAFRSVCQLREPERFGAWFAAIVRNRSRRVARSGRPDVCLSEANVGENQRWESFLLTHPPPLEWGEVRDAVAGLRTDLRELVTLYYLHGYTVGEIANYLLLPVTTVKWQLHAARAILKRKLEETQDYE